MTDEQPQHVRFWWEAGFYVVDEEALLAVDPGFLQDENGEPVGMIEWEPGEQIAMIIQRYIAPAVMQIPGIAFAGAGPVRLRPQDGDGSFPEVLIPRMPSLRDLSGE